MFEYLKRLGVNPGDSHELRLKKFTLLIITISCCVAAPIWSLAYYLIGLETSALVPFVYLLLVGPAIGIFIVTRKEKLLINIQLFAIFLCPAVMQVLAGGLLKGGVIILWSFLAPLSALIFLDVAKARFWMAMVIAAIVATTFLNTRFEQFGTYINKTQKLTLISMNLCGASAVIYFAIQYFVKTIHKNNRLLDEEKQKADRLLLNILPEKVAEELKLSGKADPALYRDATIIFSDFKDFSQISELLTPEELIGELDRCFKKFDEIVTAHGLEKIKTIGDAYMCVAGIPSNPHDTVNNAIRAIEAAMDMAEFVNEIKTQKREQGKLYWEIRIGVHTGDVVAGIVGQKKFAFDIWGDAVNVAARMEQHCEAGKINISQTTYELVRERFVCSYRGHIEAKNKGELNMYYIQGLRSMRGVA